LKEFVRNQPTAFDQIKELAIDFGVEKVGFATSYGWTEELKDELRRTDHGEAAFRGPLRYFPNLTKLILIVTLEKKMSRTDEIECKIELVEHFERLRMEDSVQDT
jgi:RNase H-fold protein (predicted Holliday junction resolvase)